MLSFKILQHALPTVLNSVTGSEGGGCTQFELGRSRMTINPRIPTMPGRSTSGFHQPDRHCLSDLGIILIQELSALVVLWAGR